MKFIVKDRKVLKSSRVRAWIKECEDQINQTERELNKLGYLDEFAAFGTVLLDVTKDDVPQNRKVTD